MPSGPFRDWWVSLLDSLGVPISGTNPLPVSSAPVIPTATGDITAAAGAPSIVQLANTVGASDVAISLQAAAFTGTVQFEVSNNGTNYVGVTSVDFSGANGALNAIALAGAINQVWSAPIAGAAFFRVRCNAYTSGTLTVVLFAGYGDGLSAVMAQLAVAATTGNPKAVLATAAYLIGSTGAASERIRTGIAATSTGAGAMSVAPGTPAIQSLTAAVAIVNGTAFPLGAARSNVSMHVTGLTSATVQLQGSNDGATYVALNSTTQNGIVSSQGVPVCFARAAVTAYTSGAINAFLAAY